MKWNTEEHKKRNPLILGLMYSIMSQKPFEPLQKLPDPVSKLQMLKEKTMTMGNELFSPVSFQEYRKKHVKKGNLYAGHSN